MKQKTKDLITKITVIVSIIGALGTLVAIGNTMLGGRGGSGSAGGGSAGGGSAGGGTAGGGTVKPNVPAIDVKLPAGCEEVYPTFFNGGIKESTGKFESTENNLYNAFAFNANKLTVGLEAKSNLKYKVFFYDSQETYLSETELLSVGKTITVPQGANARIEIDPVEKVTWNNAPLLANKLHVYVQKGQKVDLTSLAGINAGETYSNGESWNYYNVLNGDYSSTNFKLKVRNGLFSVTGARHNGGDYDTIELPFALDKNLAGQYKFNVDSFDQPNDTVGKYKLLCDQIVSSRAGDKVYFINPNKPEFDTAKISSTHPEIKIVGGLFQVSALDLELAKPFEFIPSLQKTTIVSEVA